jgi:hypothetical protein
MRKWGQGRFSGVFNVCCEPVVESRPWPHLRVRLPVRCSAMRRRCRPSPARRRAAASVLGRRRIFQGRVVALAVVQDRAGEGVAFLAKCGEIRDLEVSGLADRRHFARLIHAGTELRCARREVMRWWRVLALVGMRAVGIRGSALSHSDALTESSLDEWPSARRPVHP